MIQSAQLFGHYPEVRLRQEDGTPNTVTLKMYSSLFD